MSGRGKKGKAGSPVMGQRDPIKRSPQQGERRSRDSSLYRDVADKSRAEGEDGVENIEETLHEAAEKLTQLSRQLSTRPREKWQPGERKFRFVVNESDDNAVPVNTKAVISELTANLEEIDAKKRELEAELNSNHKANKLQIAQIKGRLAQLQRRKTEIETLLAARESEEAAESASD